MDTKELRRSLSLGVRHNRGHARRRYGYIGVVSADGRGGVEGDELEAVAVQVPLVGVNQRPDELAVFGAGGRVDDVDAAPAGDERRDAAEGPTVVRRLRS